MRQVQDIINAADPSTQEGINTLAREVNLALATRIAEKIFSMDYFSAQLRLIHTAPLREGQFDARTVVEIHQHLSEVHHISGHLMNMIDKLTPTITEPAPAPEKEIEK